MSTPYPKEPISPLRARMIDDMRVRNFSLATQRGYIRGVKLLAAFLGRSPDIATAEDLRTFQRHLAATGVTPGVQNMTVSGLRCSPPIRMAASGLIMVRNQVDPSTKGR